MYSVDGDSAEHFKLGEFEVVSSKAARPGKKITDHGDWTICWILYQQAVVFLYPHCERELRDHYSYINGTFTALASSERHRAIAFDHAIRSELARGNRKLLTDFGAQPYLHPPHPQCGSNGCDKFFWIASAQATSTVQASPGLHPLQRGKVLAVRG